MPRKTRSPRLTLTERTHSWYIGTVLPEEAKTMRCIHVGDGTSNCIATGCMSWKYSDEEDGTGFCGPITNAVRVRTIDPE